MVDLISRQAAIDAINELHELPNAWLDLAVDTLEKLPSAQPTFEPLSMEEFVGEISPTTPDTIVKWLDLARHIYGMGYVVCRQ